MICSYQIPTYTTNNIPGNFVCYYEHPNFQDNTSGKKILVSYSLKYGMCLGDGVPKYGGNMSFQTCLARTQRDGTVQLGIDDDDVHNLVRKWLKNVFQIIKSS